MLRGIASYFSLSHPKARPFCDADWQGFAGAVSWPGKATPENQPVIREVGDYVIVAGAETTEAICNSDGFLCSYMSTMAFPNQQAALSWLNLLPQDFDPEMYGFEPL